MQVLGMDIGGSGIKGALVDTETGEMVTERHRIPTPQPATPALMIQTMADIVAHFNWQGPVGCGFPAVVKYGVVQTAANISSEWVGVSVKTLLEEATGCQVSITNDADAAGVAEIQLGAGRGRSGLIVVVTLGTGIGTALFMDGRLVPNTELGHIEMGGRDAETYAAADVRKKQDLKWDEWSHRLDEYLHMMEALLWPDLFIIGGGVSKKSEKFFPNLTLRTEVVHAKLLNHAGIIGAALAARQELERS